MSEMSAILRADDQLHLSRSHFIDAHAIVERAVIERLEKHGVNVSGHLFGHNIEVLRKIKAAPQFSKAERTKLHLALDELVGLQQARCDIVHGHLQMVRIDGEALACFVNCRDQAANGSLARLISVATFTKMSTQLRKLAAEILPAKINQASSPPPPAPDAAGGP